MSARGTCMARRAAASTAGRPGRGDDLGVADPDGQPVGVEIDVGAAERGDQPAPVRVGALEHAAHQDVLADGPGGALGLALVAGAGDGEAGVAGSALAVGHDLLGELAGAPRRGPRRRPDLGSPMVTPEAPLARTSAQSLVLWVPSTEITLNEQAIAARSSRRSRSGSTAASVVTSVIVVAMSGRIIPAPLAIAPIRTSRPCRVRVAWASLVERSVVRIARAASAPPSADSFVGGVGDARADLLHRERHADHAGRGDQHLGGVEAERGGGLLDHRERVRSPWAPVQALAFPALVTIARAWPSRRGGGPAARARRPGGSGCRRRRRPQGARTAPARCPASPTA